MKKIITIILAIALSLVLVSCGTEEKDTSGITSITIQENYSDVSINVDALLLKDGYVRADVERDSSINFDELNNLIEFVIEDESIAKIKSLSFDESDKYSKINTVICELKGIKNGKTTGYFQSTDGNVKSSSVTITVEGVQASSEKTTEPNIENMKLDEAVDYVIENSNVKKDDVRIFTNDKTEIQIYLITQEGFSNSSTVSSMHLDAQRILQQLQKRNDIDNIIISWDMETTDVYGNNNTINVMSMTISKDTLKKIDFNNFAISNFPDVADKYYLAAQLQ